MNVERVTQIPRPLLTSLVCKKIAHNSERCSRLVPQPEIDCDPSYKGQEEEGGEVMKPLPGPT